MNEPKFKEGDQVVMHSCEKAEDPNYKGIIYTCKYDSYNGMVHVEGVGSMNVKHLAIVYPNKVKEPSTFEMQQVEVKDDQVPKVIAELSRRGIMFIQTKSEDEGYQIIYFKAPHEVFTYIYYEIL
ncbi:MAG: hypothetical protein VYB38_14285 [Bacteroidota bacterium]|nr:hypothetical protein [Bacteroidota bacterium]MEC8885286.1 hypothetical protein [Bacteroidota bacterium]MEE3244097.1 hypothetical protein [Bacteroidota bacterium]